MSDSFRTDSIVLPQSLTRDNSTPTAPQSSTLTSQVFGLDSATGGPLPNPAAPKNP